MTDTRTRSLTGGLIVTLAVNSAIAPFATDAYTPAFPDVVRTLSTTAGAVGITLTTFFVGLAAGQLVGGPLSDRFGRRGPLLLGGLVCTVGAVACALAPGIGVLVVARAVQGFGGGIAAAVARAVLVDIARGAELARALSLVLTLSGLAPMLAPILGAGVLAAGGDWRAVFWCLVLLGLAMTASAALVVRETLPPGARHSGGLRAVAGSFGAVLADRVVVGYLLVTAGASAALLAYVADAAYVLQGLNGVAPLPYGLFFAATALAQVGVSLMNARIVRRFGPHRMLSVGLAVAALAVGWLAVVVIAFSAPLVPVAIGFVVLMSVAGMIGGNAAALAASRTPERAGATSSLLGLVQAASWGIAAPLASLGGSVTAVPMAVVMLAGIALAVVAFRALASRGRVVA